MNKEYITIEKLDNYNIPNLFTLKPLDFKIDNINLDNNYNKVKDILNIDIIKSPIQNHTNIVKVLDENNINDEFRDCDGLITNLKNIGLAVKIADCQGIILLDRKRSIIGNIHSGWKGTLNRILTNAINLMISEFNSNISDIELFFSPSILECCFQVDSDVRDMFLNSFNDIDINSCITLGEIIDNKQKYNIDTQKVNELVSIKLGIKKEHIYLSNICSKCNSNIIHSYREDKEISGRNLYVVCLK